MWADWTTRDRITAVGVVVSVLALILAALSRPEVQDALDLEYSPTHQRLVQDKERISAMREERDKIVFDAKWQTDDFPTHTVLLRNSCKFDIFVAALYFAPDGQWERRGWFQTKPGETNKILLRSKSTSIYFYGEGAGGLKWEGKGDTSVQKEVVPVRFAAADYMSLPESLTQTVSFFSSNAPGQDGNILQEFACK
jgi:hypothetical protein